MEDRLDRWILKNQILVSEKKAVERHDRPRQEGTRHEEEEDR